MVTTRKKNHQLLLLDESVPIEHRKRLFAELCAADSREASALVEKVLAAAARGEAAELDEKRRLEAQELLEALRGGPQRDAVFVRLLPGEGALRRAMVRLHDGTPAYPAVPDAALAESLRAGEGVLLGARAEAVLTRLALAGDVGEEARLECDLGDRVEVSIRGEERHLVHLSAVLRRRIDAGEARVGSRVVACPRRAMAFDVVPGGPDAASAYRFLCREPVPDVIASRDIGDPPAFIEEAAMHCRREMRSAPRRRKYRLRRTRTWLLAGVSGSGKTLAIHAAIRRMYEEMSQRTGVPMEQLPPRVIRLRMSKLLSKWFGETDKLADRFADEIAQLAATTWPGAPGEPVELPVIVVLEEFDAIALARGGDHDRIYDRVQTTLLQRLDHTANPVLRDRLVVLFATSNVESLIDPAWIRRVGGETVRFGRLGRRGFAMVLDRHLDGLPVAGEGGGDRERRAAIVRRVTAWLYGGGDDQALVELDLAGTGAPERRHRRDFLTGSLVDRAVQRAADRAAAEEEAGAGAAGVTAAGLMEAIDRQARAVAGSLTAANAASFVAVPEGARVVNVRRLEAPAVAAHELERPLNGELTPGGT